jgi:hypothetical protein
LYSTAFTHEITLAAEASEKICPGEEFTAQCGRGETILMTHAALGRMKLGRCIQTDFGHLGCQKNVIAKLDSLCSGKKQCFLPRLIKQDFDGAASQNFCPDELEVYLELSFLCVTGKLPILSLNYTLGRLDYIN